MENLSWIKSRLLRAMCLVFAALALMTGGCEDNAKVAQQAGKPRLGVLIYNSKDTYIALVCQRLEKALAGKVELVLQDAVQDQFTQDEQYAKMLDSKIDGALINIVDIQMASGMLDKSKKAGIPVIFFNREPDLDRLKAYNKARFVGTTAKDGGIMQGDLIKRLWDAHSEYDRNRDGKIQYVMLQASPDNPEAVARTEYSVRRAAELGLAMQQLGETYMCNWREDWASDAMKLALARFGDKIEMVISNNDSMALGAVSALNEFGFNLAGGARDKFIPIVGVDATPQAVEAIGKGLMSATVRQDAEGMADALAVMILNAVNNREFLDSTGLVYDQSGIAVRIPYSHYSGQ